MAAFFVLWFFALAMASCVVLSIVHSFRWLYAAAISSWLFSFLGS